MINRVAINEAYQWGVEDRAKRNDAKFAGPYKEEAEMKNPYSNISEESRLKGNAWKIGYLR